MNWLDNIQVSLYETHSDNVGRPACIREALTPSYDDMRTIETLRSLDRKMPEFEKFKLKLKALLSCYTPAAVLKTKARGELEEISRSGLMQLDFDYKDICDYDIEELKQCVFQLQFIAFCGLSCRGDGFYVLAVIAEPYRLSEYAEHCFKVFDRFGIKADTSKGKKVENLRYVSWDQNMLVRDNPEPLKIPPTPKKIKAFKQEGERKSITGDERKVRIAKVGLDKIKSVQVGQRWQTVQQVAYTLGGLGDKNLLSAIANEIELNSAFDGLEDKYRECACVCFEAGLNNPLPKQK